MVAEKLLQLLKERQQLNDNGMVSHKRKEFEKLHYYYFRKYALYYELEKLFQSSDFSDIETIVLEGSKIVKEEQEQLQKKVWEKHILRKKKEIQKQEKLSNDNDSLSKQNKILKKIEQLKKEIQIQEQEVACYINELQKYKNIFFELESKKEASIKLKCCKQYFLELQNITSSPTEVMNQYANLRKEEEVKQNALRKYEEEIQQLEQKEHHHVLKAVKVKDDCYVLKCFVCNKYTLLSKNHEKVPYFLTPTGGVYKESKDRILVLEEHVQKEKQKNLKK